MFESILSPQSRKHLNFLLATQYWPLDELKKHQRSKLHALLRHSYANVPFYRERFDAAGLTPEQCLDPCVFREFPVLTKEQIQQQKDSMISITEHRENLLPDSTGGSTGTPLNFFHDSNYFNWEKAAAVRAWKYFPGFTEKEITALFWGAERDIGKGLRFFEVLRALVRERVLSLNTFDLDPDLIRSFFKYYRLVRPKIIRGYASSLYFLARYLRDEHILFVKPRAIVSSAETLWPAMRSVVQQEFGAPVFDSYGCREVSQIATECEAHKGLHIVMENQYVEVIDGQIVVTNLTNYCMPFIRYRIGDCADRIDESPCPCGRNLSRLIGLRGRESETIVLPNGKMIHGEYLTHLFYGMIGIAGFTAHYRSGSGTLEIMCDDLAPGAREMVRQRIEKDFAFRAVEFRTGSGGEKTRTGKFQFVKVTPD